MQAKGKDRRTRRLAESARKEFWFFVGGRKERVRLAKAMQIFGGWRRKTGRAFFRAALVMRSALTGSGERQASAAGGKRQKDIWWLFR